MQRFKVEKQNFRHGCGRARADLATPPGQFENVDVVVFKSQGDCRPRIVVSVNSVIGTSTAFRAPEEIGFGDVGPFARDREPGLFRFRTARP
jgi:hypothetical protein